VFVLGAIGAGITFYVCVVGMVGTFGEKSLVRGVVSLGQALLLLTWLGTGYLAAVRGPAGAADRIAAGAFVGAFAGVTLMLLQLVSAAFPVRSFLPNISPDLFELLTLEAEPAIAGAWIPLAIATALGALGASLTLLPRVARRLVIANLTALVLVGLFAGLVRTPMLSGPGADVARTLFASEGLTTTGAWVTILVTSVLMLLWDLGSAPARTRVRALPVTQRRRLSVPLTVIAILLVLWLPLGMGSFAALAIAFIALYILMGLGLNITLGLAGLLDLGFVAFFAVGGYVVGLLTSTGEFGIAQWPFWAAVPFAVLAAMAFGVFLGLPILGIRGDYLAIATLGFGAIVEILARSNLLLPILGGPQGVTAIPPPIRMDPDEFLFGPTQIYYISLAAAVLVGFVAYRLRGSRLGRAWIAIREDEDVAEALGVNLVQTKVLAYMLGAAFAGLGGAIFAGLIGAMFPTSINLYVSINIVAIVVVGGMGSIPGVVVGSILLIGLPELFRELNEFRFLFYGLVLIIVMRVRPQGLLPTRIGQAEHFQPTDPVMAAALEADEDVVEEDRALMAEAAVAADPEGRPGGGGP
jgi:branched-chain amino acid transport system permease protein